MTGPGDLEDVEAWEEGHDLLLAFVAQVRCFPFGSIDAASLFQESVDAEGPVVEKIMSSRSVKKQVSAECRRGTMGCGLQDAWS